MSQKEYGYTNIICVEWIFLTKQTYSFHFYSQINTEKLVFYSCSGHVTMCIISMS